MFRQLRNPWLYTMLLADVVIFALSLVGAYAIRFDFELAQRHKEQILVVLTFGVPIKLLVFATWGLYRSMWRYTGIRDIGRVAQASAVGSLAVICLIVYRDRFHHFSRTVFLLDAMLTFLLAAGARTTIRLAFGIGLGRSSRAQGWRKWWTTWRRLRIPVIIIGAGDSGARILHEIQEGRHGHFTVACFLDDDPDKFGRALHGVPVFGPVKDLPKALERYQAREVFIATPAATGPQMRQIVTVCEEAGAPFKTLPTLSEIIDGRVSIKSLRDVNYQDILGRPSVQLDTDGIAHYLSAKTVLITGCGGSIGSELCRQIVRFNPAFLVLLDASEFNLYQIQMELLHELKCKTFAAVLGRVQDRELLDNLFRRYRPGVVFHAAAYKHVPLIEENPWEAVRTNILGSRTVMDAARQHGAERFLLVSTDKAVRPTNVMGASKRMTEMFMQALPAGDTKFMAVRFGNVLGSAGSVVPLFRRQIERGGPVTVTHPDVTRYFMTIPEATQLILQAGSMGQGREIFLLEMGTPVKIADMAYDLIKLSGKEPGEDIQIVFTGLRPGEKLFEELITEGEGIQPTRHAKIKMLQVDRASSAEEKAKSLAELDGRLEELLKLAGNYDAMGIKTCLRNAVGDYTVESSTAVL